MSEERIAPNESEENTKRSAPRNQSNGIEKNEKERTMQPSRMDTLRAPHNQKFLRIASILTAILLLIFIVPEVLWWLDVIFLVWSIACFIALGVMYGRRWLGTTARERRHLHRRGFFEKVNFRTIQEEFTRGDLTHFLWIMGTGGLTVVFIVYSYISSCLSILFLVTLSLAATGIGIYDYLRIRQAFSNTQALTAQNNT